MASSLSPFAQRLLGALSQLGPNQNPYVFLSDQLNAQLLPTLPTSAAKQLYFLAALFGFAGLLILISQAIRWRKGIIWFYRWQSEYSIIRPHATLSWSPLAVVVVALFEAFIVRTIQLAKDDPKADYGYWLLMVWASAWVAGAVAAWSIAASFIVHLHSSGSRHAPPKSVSIACNVLGIASPLVYLAILLPLGILAGKNYAAMDHTAVRFKRFLAVEAQQWVEGTPFSYESIAPSIPLLDQLVRQSNDLIYWWKAVFMFYAVTAFAVLIPIASISFFYLSSLKRTIQRTGRDLRQTSFGSVTNHPQKQIKHTWIALVVITTALSLLAAMFLVVSLYAFIRPLSLRQNATFQGVIFTPLYAFGALGTPCAIVLFIRAIEARSSEKRLAEKQQGKGSKSQEDSGSYNCWNALWSSGNHGSKTRSSSSGGAGAGGGGGGVEHELTVGGGGRDGERRKDSVLVSFGEILRGGGGGGGGISGESRNSRHGGGGRRREESGGGGVGSNVMVDVQVEVQEDVDVDNDVEEKEMRIISNSTGIGGDLEKGFRKEETRFD